MSLQPFWNIEGVCHYLDPFPECLDTWDDDKPIPPAYATAFARASELLGQPITSSKILGDSVNVVSALTYSPGEAKRTHAFSDSGNYHVRWQAGHPSLVLSIYQYQRLGKTKDSGGGGHHDPLAAIQKGNTFPSSPRTKLFRRLHVLHHGETTRSNGLQLLWFFESLLQGKQAF